MTKHAHPDERPTAERATLTVAGPMMDACQRAGEACARAYVGWQEELARFVTARFDANRRLAQSLAECRSPLELVAVQQNWALAAAQDYFEEAGRLARIGLRLVQAGPAGTGDDAPSAPAKGSRLAA